MGHPCPKLPETEKGARDGGRLGFFYSNFRIAGWVGVKGHFSENYILFGMMGLGPKSRNLCLDKVFPKRELG